MPGRTRKLPAPSGLGPSGRRLWREFTDELELKSGEYTLLAQAARTVDACEWLTAVADDPELPNVERRLAHAEARAQRVVLARLVEQLRPPAKSPSAVATAAAGRLEQLRAIHRRTS